MRVPRPKRFLFTTLMSEDLGLVTRTLPVAKELEKQGHKVFFCNPARIPGKVIEEAGIENLRLNHPLMYLGSFGRPSLTQFLRLLQSGQMKRDFGSVGSFLKKYGQALPGKFAPSTSEVWDMDHLYALTLALNEGYSRCTCEAFMRVMEEHEVDVVVDAWNLWAAMAARVLGKPLATIIQADMHPASRGFVWWKERMRDMPTPVPVVNKLLGEYGLEPVSTTAEFNVGDLTLVLGIPETDPLPDHAKAEHIGAILWQQEDGDLPGWFDALRTDKPIVWVYSANPRYGPASAWADSGVVLEACIDALPQGEPP